MHEMLRLGNTNVGTNSKVNLKKKKNSDSNIFVHPGKIWKSKYNLSLLASGFGIELKIAYIKKSTYVSFVIIATVLDLDPH